VPALLDVAGLGELLSNKVDFTPTQAMTDEQGRACFAAILSLAVPPRLLRIRYELPDIDSGDAGHSPLGCEWGLLVLDPNTPKPSNPAEPVQTLYAGDGQGQVVLTGSRAPVPLAVVARTGTAPDIWASFRTTQPGDRLSIVEGILHRDTTDPATGLQELSVFTTAGRIKVGLELGSIPLPRTVIMTAYDRNPVVFAVGPPEVYFAQEDARGKANKLVAIPTPDMKRGILSGSVPLEAHERFVLEARLPASWIDTVSASVVATDSVGLALPPSRALNTEDVSGNAVRFLTAPSALAFDLGNGGIQENRFRVFRSGPLVACDSWIEGGTTVISGAQAVAKDGFGALRGAISFEGGRYETRCPSAGVAIEPGGIQGIGVGRMQAWRTVARFPRTVEIGSVEASLDDGSDNTDDIIPLAMSAVADDGGYAAVFRWNESAPLGEGLKRLRMSGVDASGILHRLETVWFVHDPELHSRVVATDAVRGGLEYSSGGETGRLALVRGRLLADVGPNMSDHRLSRHLRDHRMILAAADRYWGACFLKSLGTTDDFLRRNLVQDDGFAIATDVPGLLSSGGTAPEFLVHGPSINLGEGRDLAVFLDIPPLPVHPFLLSERTMSPQNAPVPIAEHPDGQVAVQDIDTGKWYELKALREGGYVEVQEDQEIILFSKAEADGFASLSGIRSIQYQLAAKVSGLVPVTAGQFHAIRQWMNMAYDFSPVADVESIGEAAENRDLAGIGMSVAAFVIPGVTGKTVKKLGQASRDFLEALLRDHFYFHPRDLASLERRYGKKLEHFSRDELAEALNRTLDPRAKLPQAAVEDLACWNMGMVARRNGLTGYVYKGRRFSKKYHGFNDLAEDLDGNIFVLESKGGSGKLDKLKPMVDPNTGKMIDVKQMDKNWVRAKIQQLHESADALDREVADELMGKWKQGKLKGRVYHTDIVDGVVGRTRTVDFDYGTEPPW